MRHSRRTVMSEHYSLYLKKNIFNGKYIIRNIQVFICTVVFFALIIALAFLGTSNQKVQESVQVEQSVKQVLFSNSEEKNQINNEMKDLLSEENLVAVKEENIIEEQVIDVDDKKEYIGHTEEKRIKQDTKKETEFEHKCIANVEETLNIRKEPSTEAEFVGSMVPGAIATVEGKEGEWTKIKSGTVEGYVLSEYILTGKSAVDFAKDYVTLVGTVLEDHVNVREKHSIDADVVTVLSKGDRCTILDDPSFVEDKMLNEEIDVEEVDKTNYDIQWLKVLLEDGKIGYVSADYISIEKLYMLAVSAKELKLREEVKKEDVDIHVSNSTVNQTSNANVAQQSVANKVKPKRATKSGECIGTFTITAYCGCHKCSKGHTRTASGTIPTEGRTIAADTSILPFGTKVVIGGVVYTVEDCGSKVNGNHIDIFFSTHAKALAFGRKILKVYKY